MLAPLLSPRTVSNTLHMPSVGCVSVWVCIHACAHVWIEFKLKYDFKISVSRVGRFHVIWSKGFKKLIFTINYPLLFTPKLAIVPSQFFFFLRYGTPDSVKFCTEAQNEIQWNQTSLVGDPGSNVHNCLPPFLPPALSLSLPPVIGQYGRPLFRRKFCSSKGENHWANLNH